MSPLIGLDFCLRNQHHQIVAPNVEQFVEQFAMPFDGLVKIMTTPTIWHSLAHHQYHGYFASHPENADKTPPTIGDRESQTLAVASNLKLLILNSNQFSNVRMPLFKDIQARMISDYR